MFVSLCLFSVPIYLNTVMPNGVCNISTQDGIPTALPVRENAHVIATAFNPNYGTHVLALGRDSKIYHKHQTSSSPESNWTSWKCLTPDLTKVPCSIAPNCRGYDNNPVVAWQPRNGTLVAMVRQMDDLVIHEFHLTNPADPDSWSSFRGAQPTNRNCADLCKACADLCEVLCTER